MKKTIFTLFLILSSITLISCTGNSNTKKIGILQYISHEDLDDARIGFIDALKEAGFENKKNIKITIFNPEAEATTMQQQASKLARSSDLVLGIGTPAAIALANETKAIGRNIPVLFTAVTDPVDAKLVKTLTNHNSNITGTSDLTPIKDQIGLISEIKPNATKVGILHNAAETNSSLQAKIASNEIKALGLEPVIKTVNSIVDINLVFSNLINKENVDAIYIPSDNLLSSSMGVLNELTKEHQNKQVPIIASTTFQVKEGAAITLGLSYLNLGIQTGKIAVRILSGTDVKTIDVETIDELELAINKKTIIDILKLSISDDLLNRADIIFE